MLKVANQNIRGATASEGGKDALKKILVLKGMVHLIYKLYLKAVI